MHTEFPLYRSWALAAFALSFLAPSVYSDTTEQAAWEVATLRGQAQWRADKQPDWKTLEISSRITPPVHVRTGAGAHVTLRRNGDSLEVSPGSLLFIPPVERRAQSWFTRVVQKIGVIDYDVRKRPHPGFQVETQYLTSLVKGTRFEVSNDTDQAAVTLLRGSLLVSNADNSESVLIKPMQAVSVSRQQPQLRVTTLRRLPPQVSAGSSASGVGTGEKNQTQSLNEVDKFSWAQGIGVGTVTQTVSSLRRDVDVPPATSPDYPAADARTLSAGATAEGIGIDAGALVSDAVPIAGELAHEPVGTAITAVNPVALPGEGASSSLGGLPSASVSLSQGLADPVTAGDLIGTQRDNASPLGVLPLNSALSSTSVPGASTGGGETAVLPGGAVLPLATPALPGL